MRGLLRYLSIAVLALGCGVEEESLGPIKLENVFEDHWLAAVGEDPYSDIYACYNMNSERKELLQYTGEDFTYILGDWEKEGDTYHFSEWNANMTVRENNKGFIIEIKAPFYKEEYRVVECDFDLF